MKRGFVVGTLDSLHDVDRPQRILFGVSQEGNIVTFFPNGSLSELSTLFESTFSQVVCSVDDVAKCVRLIGVRDEEASLAFSLRFFRHKDHWSYQASKGVVLGRSLIDETPFERGGIVYGQDVLEWIFRNKINL